MRIALIGTRGIPATHGGFETCVEEVGARLASRGHDVTVYSRPSGSRMRQYRGMRVVSIPRVPVRGVETLLATCLAVMHSLLFGRYHVHMVFDNANAPALLPYRLLGKAFALNPDGLGWQRDKWGLLARKYYRWCEWLAVKLCPHLVTDSRAMQDYYVREYGAHSTVIEYGASLPSADDENAVRRILGELGLIPRGYFLQVTRLEPENNPLLTVEAFRQAGSPYKLVLVGGVPRPTRYLRQVLAVAAGDPRIVMPGAIYDQDRLAVIWRNCFAYIHGNQTGGTNPALLQAMAAGRPIIARDCVFNREVLGENGLYYDRTPASLVSRMQTLIRDPAPFETAARRALERVRSYYAWDRIASLYEQLFVQISSSSPPA